MAHYAFLDDNNIVTEVITGVDETELIEGLDPETWYGNFRGQKCVRTSYNRNIRRVFAGKGFFYDEERDIFIAPEIEGNYWDAPWMGQKTPVSPSIIIDAVPRCANRWFNIIVNKSFPTAYQKWGFESPHNPESFSWAKEKFDVFATIIRNPLDSMASSIVFFQLNNEESITRYLNLTIKFLEETLSHKEYVDIFKFEDITNNLSDVINYIGGKLNLSPMSLDLEAIKNELDSIYGSNDYIVPTNNTESLDLAKTTLNDSKYASLLAKATDLYNELTQYSWSK